MLTLSATNAVMRVHVVDGETQVAKPVARELVVERRVGEYPVAPPADVVADYLRARRVPDIDAVATAVHALIAASEDHVAPDQRVLSAVNVDTVEIAFQAVVLDTGPVSTFQKPDTTVDVLVRRTGAG